MKKFIVLSLIWIFATPAFCQINSIQEFKDHVDSIGLKFEMPEGYSIAKVKENRDLTYSFSIINSDLTMEVRYTIWSLKPSLEEYKKSLKDPKITMINPNYIYKGRIEANVLNMTGGQWYDIGSFPPKAVLKEFNAEKGGSCFFEFNCEFGKGYKFGQFVYLHKDNIADVIITYLSNKKETHHKLMMIPFHSLKFK